MINDDPESSIKINYCALHLVSENKKKMPCAVYNYFHKDI